MNRITETMTKHFTCIGRGHGAPCLPATREEWEQMRREPWLAEMCRRIEDGDEQLKSKLEDIKKKAINWFGKKAASERAGKEKEAAEKEFKRLRHDEEIQIEKNARLRVELGDEQGLIRELKM